MMANGKPHKREQLSPEEKWEVFLALTSSNNGHLVIPRRSRSPKAALIGNKPRRQGSNIDIRLASTFGDLLSFRLRHLAATGVTFYAPTAIEHASEAVVGTICPNLPGLAVHTGWTHGVAPSERRRFSTASDAESIGLNDQGVSYEQEHEHQWSSPAVNVGSTGGSRSRDRDRARLHRRHHPVRSGGDHACDQRCGLLPGVFAASFWQSRAPTVLALSCAMSATIMASPQ
jgi:hypothetical protein